MRATSSALLLLTLTLSSAGILAQGSFDTYRDGVVQVGQFPVNGSPSSEIMWLGTAFVVDSQCTFVSAKHILANAARDRLVVRFQLPSQRTQVRTIQTRVLFASPTNDLLFLRTDSFNGQPCRSGDLHPLPLTKDPLSGHIGEAVFLIGHPTISALHTDFPIYRAGVIASSELLWDSQPMILLDLVGVPGFSGSPVVLQRNGTAIGAVFGPGPTDRGAAFEWATPITAGDYQKALQAEAPPKE
jgi:S1-C subfamily serine protease